MSANADPDQSGRRVIVASGQGLQVGDHNEQFNQFQFIDTYIDSRPRPDGPVVRSAYLEQVRRIAPGELLDRAAELAELAAFCTEPVEGPYTWWRAPAWAGKSALMSWFVLHPPPGVQIVSFFVTARWKGHDDRGAFINAALEQLAGLLEEPIPAYLNETTREPHLLGMMTRGAEKCAGQGQRLVLVVDGLDEDRGVTTGPDAHSIAELLPARPPAGMRVIVAGRSDPPVPGDVPDNHPLRDLGIVRTLAASRRAAVVRADLQRELKRLLAGSVAEQDLLGLITAAGGGLSAMDLAHLTGMSAFDIHESLGAVAGRTFTARVSQWHPAGPTTYVLGHEELQAAAVASLGAARIAGYRRRLYAWADEYRQQGWPEGTPEYLLRGYPRLLQDIGDIPRLLACATDQARHDRMLDITGGDTAALAEIMEAQHVALSRDDPDLSALARLNVHRNLIAERNAYVPVALPAVWAAIGHPERGEALARAIADPAQRTRALAALARIAIEAGDLGRARTLADMMLAAIQAIADPSRRWKLLDEEIWIAADKSHSEPVLPDLLLTATQAILDPVGQAHTRQSLARAATKAGEPDRAVAAAQAIADPAVQAPLLAELALAAARVGDFARAGTAARAITSPGDRAQTLADLARSASDAGNPAQAGLLAGHALDATQMIAEPAIRVRLLADLAPMAERAGDLERAGTAARAITIPGDRAQALAALARTAADGGDLGQASRLTGEAVGAAPAVSDSARKALLLAGLAWTAAKTGDAAGAGMLAGQALDAALAIINPYRQAQVLADLAWDFEAAGLLDRALIASQAIADPGHQAQVLAGLARMAADGGDSQRAGFLYGQAMEAAQAITDPVQRAPALARLAMTAAKTGDPDRSLAAALAITDWGIQGQVLAELAQAAADAGASQRASLLTGLALNVAMNITDSGFQGQVLARLARAAAKTGDHNQAGTAVEAITNLGLRAQVFAELAQAAADTGDLSRARLLTGLALTAAHAVTRPGHRERVLTGVALMAARTGDMSRALATAEEVADSHLWAQILTDTTRRAAQAGDPGWALATAQKIIDPALRAQVLDNLARTAVREGDLDQARIMLAHALDANQADDHPYRASHVLVDLVQTAVRAGVPGLVVTAVRAIREPVSRAGLLTSLAQSAADSGDPNQARMLIGDAMEAAQAITDPLYRDAQTRIRAELARMSARAGDLERATTIVNEALTAARAVTNPDERAHKLAEVARAAAEAGDFELAGTAAREITIPFWQPQVLAEIAGAAKEADDLPQARTLAIQALTAARIISDPDRKAQMLDKLAQVVARTGSSERAQKLADLARAAVPVAASQHGGKAPIGGQRVRDPDDHETPTDQASESEPTLLSAGLAEALTTQHWLASIDVLAKISPAAVIAIADEYLSVPVDPV
jgi:tetratricopeptide (TPR) repeat protein